MIKEIDRRIRRALGGIRQAFRMVLGSTDSGAGVQLTNGEGLADEQVQAMELMQHYGFTSVPLSGTQAVVIPLGGKTSHGIVIATEHGSYRLQGLKAGEVALYTDEGSRIVLKRGRLIDVECDEFNVKCKRWNVEASDGARFDTPVLTATKTAVVDGMLTGKGGLALSNENGEGGSENVGVIRGTLRVTEDVIVDGVSSRRHRHPTSYGITDEPLK